MLCRFALRRSLRLADIALVRGGYIGPSAVSDAAGPSPLRALQSRDVAADGTVNWGALKHSNPSRDAARYAINDGDVLLALRSAKPHAIVARQVPPGVIAAGQWAVITPRQGVLDPDFTAWFLNHPATAARLNRLVQGGTLPFLSLVAVRDFDIVLPPFEVQRRVSRIAVLHTRLGRLERELADARTRLIDGATISAVESRR
jgi:hypothetical protein